MISLHKNNTDSVLGLFDVDHCKYNYEIDGISDSVPTLAEMTMKAIELLSQNEKGFLLFVEGAAEYSFICNVVFFLLSLSLCEVKKPRFFSFSVLLVIFFFCQINFFFYKNGA